MSSSSASTLDDRAGDPEGDATTPDPAPVPDFDGSALAGAMAAAASASGAVWEYAYPRSGRSGTAFMLSLLRLLNSRYASLWHTDLKPGGVSRRLEVREGGGRAMLRPEDTSDYGSHRASVFPRRTLALAACLTWRLLITSGSRHRPTLQGLGSRLVLFLPLLHPREDGRDHLL